MAEEPKEKRPQKPQKAKSDKSNDQNDIRRLYRSRTDRIIAGVCGGVGEYFNVDPVIVRVVWVISVFFAGFGILPYIIGWVIIPENPSQEPPPPKEKGGSRNTALIWGVILIAIGGFFLFEQLDWFNYYPFHFRWHWNPWWFGGRFDLLLAIFLIAIGVIYIYQVTKKEKEGETTKAQETAGGKNMDKKLTRSVKERMIGGVCGGIANYFNIDPTIVRIGWAIVTLITNFIPGIVAYIVMLIVVPEESAVDSTASSSKPTTQKAKTQK